MKIMRFLRRTTYAHRVLLLLLVGVCAQMCLQTPLFAEEVSFAQKMDSHMQEIELLQKLKFDLPPKNQADYSVKLYEIQRKIDDLRLNGELLESQLDATPLFRAKVLPYHGQNRTVTEKLYLTDAKLQNGSIFRLDMNHAKAYRLALINRIQPRPLDDSPELVMEVKCTDDFKIKNETVFTKVKANRSHPLRIQFSGRNYVEGTSLYLPLNIKSCELRFDSGETITLQRDVGLPYSDYEVCSVPKTEEISLQQLTGTQFVQAGCPLLVDNIENIEDGEQALRVKAENLLGRKLPEGFVENQNPYAPLDFSATPTLKVIYISTLQFHADFYGTLMARLLEHHASKGTAIRIIVADVIVQKKDIALLNKMVTRYPQIKVQYFRFKSAHLGSVGDIISSVHRTMHIKLFVAISADRRLKDLVVLGGRNIHDGSLYKETPDYSQYKDLVHYPTESRYAYWRDFEIAIRDHNFAEQSARQFVAMWERDSKTNIFRPASIPLGNPNIISGSDLPKDKFLVRQVFSWPFLDDRSLENYYVNLFESAQKEIWITTPYFNLTKRLGKALTDAAARGVKVTVITRLDLAGDTLDVLISETNRRSINLILNEKMHIFSYTEPNVILHSKFIMIDDVLSVVGTVNLNRRSFLHDTENALIIYGPAYAQKIKSVFDLYLNSKVSVEITDPLKRNWWKEPFIQLLINSF